MTYLVYMILHVLAVSIVVLMIFIKKPGFRLVGVVCGAVAIWLPLFMLLKTLGLPHPDTPSGKVRILGSKMHDTEDVLYVFVDTLGRDKTPRVFSIPVERKRYSRRGNAVDYTMQVVSVEPGDGGMFELVYVDYEPPDLLKGGMMRRYRGPDSER